MISSIIKTLFQIKIQPNIKEQEKKRQSIYDLLNAEPKPKFLCLPFTKQRKKIHRKRVFLRKKGCRGLNKKQKESFLTAVATAIEKDPTTSIRKYAYELKVHEKTEDSN